MNLKKRIKERLESVRRNDGFTLVELIVVIAILGVLAGVAVPAYSGYVKKANMAADEQLVAAINTAFASACMANGESCYGRADVQAGIAAKKFVYTEPYAAEFESFFEGGDSEFKEITSLVYDAEFGGFKNPATAESLTLAYGDGFVKVSGEAVTALKNSTFVNADGLGVEGLMNKVDFVATFASGVNSSTYDSIIESPDYKKKFLENLGVDVSALNPVTLITTYNQKYAEMVTAAVDKMAQENGWTDAEKTANREDVANKVKANMAVLYAAQSTGSLTDAQINTLLNTDNPKATILSGATNADNLAQAALYYGMYVSYAHYKGDQGLINATNNPINLLTSPDLDTAGFKAYIGTDQGKADLAAYIASMNIVKDSATNEGAVNSIVVNGFSDAELIALIQQVVGK